MDFFEVDSINTAWDDVTKRKRSESRVIVRDTLRAWCLCEFNNESDCELVSASLISFCAFSRLGRPTVLQKELIQNHKDGVVIVLQRATG